MKKIFQFVSIMIILILGMFLFLFLINDGKPEPIRGDTGTVATSSISTIEVVSLGGIDQHLIIRGVDVTKPVMLFLHGGPGSPEFIFLKNPDLTLEENFIMVYWEQRGAGKSYSADIPPESMALDQFINDTHELSKALADRFNREKIFLMGHSWGSLLGLKTADQHPELFHAYIGIGQLSHPYEGEQISLDWVNANAAKLNDEKAKDLLASLELPDVKASNDKWLDYLMIERGLVNEYGGGMTRAKFDTYLDLGKLMIQTNEYTLLDKYKYLQGNFFSMKHLWDDLIQTNLFEEIDSIRVPVYFLHGRYDYQAPYALTKRFFDQMKAVDKEFFPFEYSAHSPFLDEPERFNRIVTQIREAIGSKVQSQLNDSTYMH